MIYENQVSSPVILEGSPGIRHCYMLLIFVCRFTLLPSPSLSERRYCHAGRHAVTLCVCPPSRLSLYHTCGFDYDTTTIRRYHYAFDYNGSDRNYDLRSIPLRYDYDTTTRKTWHVNFLLASNRVEWKQARAIRRSRIVVVSQSTRAQIVISITFVVVECVVVSSYRMVEL